MDLPQLPQVALDEGAGQDSTVKGTAMSRLIRLICRADQFLRRVLGNPEIDMIELSAKLGECYRCGKKSEPTGACDAHKPVHASDGPLQWLCD